MPIVDYTYENGIFYAREMGQITEDDAKEWAAQAEKYAQNGPIVALVDASEVIFITLEARRVFGKASAIENLVCGAIATGEFMTRQMAKSIGMMADNRHTFVFDTLEEARAFAEKQVQALHGPAQT